VNQETCCPRFDPTLWDGKMLDWKDKRFIKGKVLTIFHMPMNFGRVMKRLDEEVRKSGATIPDRLCLSDHTSKWNMDVYLAVDREIPEVENVTWSGEFFSKVYDGPYKDTGKWCKDFESLAKGKGLNIRTWYMWYTTCPKCAKKYGKNYVVIMANLSEKGG
jgi:Bacterial hydrolase